jgi:hydroxysqualene synthase
MSVDHYENFPVASFLCPAPLRPAIQAIYFYARTADDLADEGNAAPPERLSDLRAYREDLLRVHAGTAPSPRWAARVFDPLSHVMASHRLPLAPLLDLLSAFEQDVVQHRYEDRGALLDYCRRSANPIGRLLLHLYGIKDERCLQQSDAICTALQLINFWQDFSVDLPRDRLYAPLSDCSAHGLTPEQLFLQQDDDRSRALVASLCDWAEELMHRGAPLTRTLPGRMGWELRWVVQGGLRILHHLRRREHACLRQRPTVGMTDLPAILWRSLRM